MVYSLLASLLHHNVYVCDYFDIQLAYIVNSLIKKSRISRLAIHAHSHIGYIFHGALSNQDEKLASVLRNSTIMILNNNDSSRELILIAY